MDEAMREFESALSVTQKKSWQMPKTTTTTQIGQSGKKTIDILPSSTSTKEKIKLTLGPFHIISAQLLIELEIDLCGTGGLQILF